MATHQNPTVVGWEPRLLGLLEMRCRRAMCRKGTLSQGVVVEAPLPTAV